MAEREGFEPSEHVSVHLISSQARSASSGTSPETQILIDPLDLEYNGISPISGKPNILIIINQLSQICETSPKLRKPNDI
jgi:hypothetical protein